MRQGAMTRSQMMARVRSKDTKPEMAVRRACHALGLRFRASKRFAGLARPDLPPLEGGVVRSWVFLAPACSLFQGIDARQQR